MAGLVQVGRTTDLEDGTMKELSVQGHEILPAKIGHSYYAADNRCPHMGGKLSRGKIKGTVVTCPRHGSQFDLKNGEVVCWLKGTGLLSKIGKALKQPQPLTTYSVTVEGDRVMIDIQG